MNIGPAPLKLSFPFLPELQIPLNIISLYPQSAFKVPHFNFSLKRCVPCPFACHTSSPSLRIIHQNLPFLLLKFWAPLRKIKQLSTCVHYTCIVYKLNLVNTFMCLVTCHFYSNSRAVKIPWSFLGPLTQAPPPSARTLLTRSYTHT